MSTCVSCVCLAPDINKIPVQLSFLPLENAVHNPRFKATHPLEDCPTPLWVSQSRWLLVDLTARRTDWGPALGGEGVVVHNTLPDVSYAFGVAEEKRTGRSHICHITWKKFYPRRLPLGIAICGCMQVVMTIVARSHRFKQNAT